MSRSDLRYHEQVETPTWGTGEGIGCSCGERFPHPAAFLKHRGDHYRVQLIVAQDMIDILTRELGK